MDKDLLAIAKEYFDRTEEAKKLLLKGLNLKSKNELLHSRGRMPHGVFYIDHLKCEYFFHGRGIRFSKEDYNAEYSNVSPQKEFKVDMELGSGDSLCGIAPWMLERYVAEYYPDRKDFDCERIKREFEDGIKEGLLYKDIDLYYFKEPDEIMTPYYKKLMEIKERPGMYLGCPSLTRLSAFMHGYENCFYDLKKKWTRGWPDGFQGWIQERYDIKSSHHWSQIILFYSSSEEEAFYKFYDLLEEYKKIYLAKKKGEN